MVHAKWHTSRGRMGMKDPPCKPGGGGRLVLPVAVSTRDKVGGGGATSKVKIKTVKRLKRSALGALFMRLSTPPHTSC